MKTKLLSIVTVVFNAERTIETTIKSVINFKHKYNDEIEYIIIDGNSTDNTLSIISQYKEHIDIVVSEPDNGIYDAMNKGWNLSSGKYIYYIGADDVLLNLPIQDLKYSGADLICGKVYLSNDKIFDCKYGSILKFRNMIHHQGLFANKELHQINPFNLKYKIYADFDFIIKCYKNGATFKYVDLIIAKFNIDGISGKFDSNEHFLVIRDNFGLFQYILALCRWKLKMGEHIKKIARIFK